MRAAENGNATVVQMLLSAGANMGEADKVVLTINYCFFAWLFDLFCGRNNNILSI